MGHRARRRYGQRGTVAGVAALVVAVACLAVYAVAGHGTGDRGGPAAAGAGPAAATAVTTSAPAPAGRTVTPSPRRATARPSPSSSRRPTAHPTASAHRTATPSPVASSSAGAPAAGAAPLAPRAGWRVFTLVNRVGQTIWVGAGEQSPQPALNTTGWLLRPGQSVSVRVPDHWNGRFWGRTGCSFDAAGRGHCETGDCAGRFQCPGYGTIPATLAEFNLNSWNGLDFYDVSLVDGSNLPMWINTVGGTTRDPISANGCSAAGCTHLVDCPKELQVHAGGGTVGCESPCGVFGTDQYCCRAQWAPRSQCRPDQWPVDYAALFKKAEPFAYSYVDDDATSTFTSNGEAGYRITFGLSG